MVWVVEIQYHIIIWPTLFDIMDVDDLFIQETKVSVAKEFT